MKWFSASRDDKHEETNCDLGISWSLDNYINTVPSKETISLAKNMDWELKKPGRTIIFWFWFHTPNKTYTFTIDFSYNYGYDWTQEQLDNALTAGERRRRRGKP